MSQSPITPEGSAEQRHLLRRIFDDALTECSISRAFQRHVAFERGILRVGQDLYALSDYDRVFVVSIGKAAYTMVQALSEYIGTGTRGIATGPTDPERMLPGLEYFHGGHPLPNAASVKAGDTILRGLRPLTERALVIFLLSGGGSALVERPVQGISLEDMVATYRALVLSGAPIAEINAIRKHLSATKGGRLAQAAHPARQVSLMISDVPENALDSLASGPTMPDSSTVEDCYALVARHDLLRQFPPRCVPSSPNAPWTRHLKKAILLLRIRAGACCCRTPRRKKPRPSTPRGKASRLRWITVATTGTTPLAADYLLGKLRALRRRAERVCLISGGEVTVKVTNGGVGGRNQQFALYCADKIAGENIAVLSVGTDGIDGNSPAAGAVVDGSTIARAEARGFSAMDALAKFDAFPLFNVLGDAVISGPTGNNVRDLRVLMAW